MSIQIQEQAAARPQEPVSNISLTSGSGTLPILPPLRSDGDFPPPPKWRRVERETDGQVGSSVGSQVRFLPLFDHAWDPQGRISSKLSASGPSPYLVPNTEYRTAGASGVNRSKTQERFDYTQVPKAPRTMLMQGGHDASDRLNIIGEGGRLAQNFKRTMDIELGLSDTNPWRRSTLVADQQILNEQHMIHNGRQASLTSSESRNSSDTHNRKYDVLPPPLTKSTLLLAQDSSVVDQLRPDDDVNSMRSMTSSNVSSAAAREREKMCYACKQQDSALNPFVKCSTCWRRFHDTCLIPRRKSESMSRHWYCKHCINRNRHAIATSSQATSMGNSHHPPQAVDESVQNETTVPLDKEGSGVFFASSGDVGSGEMRSVPAIAAQHTPPYLQIGGHLDSEAANASLAAVLRNKSRLPPVSRHHKPEDGLTSGQLAVRSDDIHRQSLTNMSTSHSPALKSSTNHTGSSTTQSANPERGQLRTAAKKAPSRSWKFKVSTSPPGPKQPDTRYLNRGLSYHVDPFRNDLRASRGSMHNAIPASARERTSAATHGGVANVEKRASPELHKISHPVSTIGTGSQSHTVQAVPERLADTTADDISGLTKQSHSSSDPRTAHKSPLQDEISQATSPKGEVETLEIRPLPFSDSDSDTPLLEKLSQRKQKDLGLGSSTHSTEPQTIAGTQSSRPQDPRGSSPHAQDRSLDSDNFISGQGVSASTSQTVSTELEKSNSEIRPSVERARQTADHQSISAETTVATTQTSGHTEPNSLLEVAAMAIFSSRDERISAREATNWILAQNFLKFEADRTSWQAGLKAKLSGSFKRDNARAEDQGLAHYIFQPGQREELAYLLVDGSPGGVQGIQRRQGTDKSDTTPLADATRHRKRQRRHSPTHEEDALMGDGGYDAAGSRAKTSSTTTESTSHRPVLSDRDKYGYTFDLSDAENPLVCSDSEDSVDPAVDHFLNADAKINVFKCKNLFSSRPDLDPNKILGADAKVKETKARLTRGGEKRRRKLVHSGSQQPSLLIDRRKGNSTEDRPRLVGLGTEPNHPIVNGVLHDPVAQAQDDFLNFRDEDPRWDEAKTMLGLLGLPEDVLPIIHEGQLAFTDGITDPGVVRCNPSIYKVGSIEEEDHR